MIEPIKEGNILPLFLALIRTKNDKQFPPLSLYIYFYSFLFLFIIIEEENRHKRHSIDIPRDSDKKIYHKIDI